MTDTHNPTKTAPLAAYPHLARSLDQAWQVGDHGHSPPPARLAVVAALHPATLRRADDDARRLARCPRVWTVATVCYPHVRIGGQVPGGGLSLDIDGADPRDVLDGPPYGDTRAAQIARTVAQAVPALIACVVAMWGDD